MLMRALGPFRVAPLAFGGNVFGWTADRKSSFALLDAFVDSGFNLIDTADVYSAWVPGHSGGESETLIGDWLKQTGKRDRIVLASKVGMDMSRLVTGTPSKGLAKGYIKAAVEASLKRLQTDHIDLYQSHLDDRETPLEESLEAFSDLVQEGKVKLIGASNYAADRLEEALSTSSRLGFAAYACLQPHYNLVDREAYEKELESVVVKHQLSVINYFGLARGFLTGKYRKAEDAALSPRGASIVSAYFNDRGFRILAALDQWSRELDATHAQLALAWQIQRPSITAPIVSATRVEQWTELARAAELHLPAEAVQALDRASEWHA